MGFNRGKIGVKATNISVMDRKGGVYLGVSGHEWGHYCYRESGASSGL